MLLRVVVVVCALAAGAWAVARDGQVRACEAAARDATRVESARAAEAVAERLSASCRGGLPLAIAGFSFSETGYFRAARRLTDEAVAREPESGQAWVAAGKAAIASFDPAGLRRAEDRLRTLDPRNPFLDRP